jgi:hypothetical protein
LRPASSAPPIACGVCPNFKKFIRCTLESTRGTCPAGGVLTAGHADAEKALVLSTSCLKGIRMRLRERTIPSRRARAPIMTRSRNLLFGQEKAPSYTARASVDGSSCGPDSSIFSSYSRFDSGELWPSRTARRSEVRRYAPWSAALARKQASANVVLERQQRCARPRS